MRSIGLGPVPVYKDQNRRNAMADIKVFAENLEGSTKEQIEEISSCPAFEGARSASCPMPIRARAA